MFGAFDTNIRSRDAVARSLSRKILGVAMGLSLAMGLCLGLLAITSPNAMKHLREKSSLGALMRGETAKVINFAMAHYLPGDQLLQTAHALVRWRVFGVGGPVVWVGRNDWLYLMDEIRPAQNAEANMSDRVAIIGKVAARLAARKIDILMVIVPMKSEIATANRTIPLSVEAEHRLATWNRLSAGLRLKTAQIYDVFAAQRDPDSLWRRADSHWSQTGAAIAAKAVAAAVTTPINRNHHFVTHIEAAESELDNDLIYSMGLAQLPGDIFIKLRPAGDIGHQERTVEIIDPTAQGGTLGDDAAAEVALVGTSFSLRSNFGGRLQEALGAPVENVSIAGGGFARSAERYFTSLQFAQRPPRLVIWEIAERVLVYPLGEDEKRLAAWAENPSSSPTNP